MTVVVQTGRASCRIEPVELSEGGRQQQGAHQHQDDADEAVNKQLPDTAGPAHQPGFVSLPTVRTDTATVREAKTSRWGTLFCGQAIAERLDRNIG